MIYDYLILGAGPSGLSFANRIKEKKPNCSFIVLEKENEPGGLCRSTVVDDYPFDIGGGHFLDTRRPKVNEFLFKFMPENEWNIYERKTSIVVGNNIIGQPFEAFIWQFPIEDQIEYLKSISKAGCNNGAEKPEKFTDWIYWKLGKRIAEDYMIPYNQKMFGKELDSLGTYWLEKLPNVSFEETLRSCIEKKRFGKDPGHSVFYYPKKYGYGELWKRLADNLGDNIIYNCEIDSLDYENSWVKDSEGNVYKGNKIIVSIPWKCFKYINGAPKNIVNDIKLLKYTSIYTEYHSEHLNTDSHWIYYPDKDISYHRILVRHNFCEGSRGYWTETNADRIDMPFVKPVQQNDENDNYINRFYNEFAYPLNTTEKPICINNILEFSKEHNIYGLGRWGEWEHYNSDLSVERALLLADEL